MNKEGGAWGPCHFGQKLLNTWCGMGRWACKSPKDVERIFKKNSLKPNTASHNNVSWYTDTGGFLGHSPSGGSLYYKGPVFQKIIPFLLRGPPLCIYIYIMYFIIALTFIHLTTLLRKYHALCPVLGIQQWKRDTVIFLIRFLLKRQTDKTK